jgi:hypothetical protein
MAPTHLPCAPNPAVSRRPDGSPRALLSLLTSSSLQPASIPADTSSLPMATSEELAQIDISKEVLLRTYSLPPCTCTHATCSAFCLTRHPGRGAGEGQAGGGGDAVRAVQDAPDLRLPHQAGGAHRDRHQELPPARAPGARHQRGPGQARRHLRLRDEGAAEDPRAVHAFGSTAAV